MDIKEKAKKIVLDVLTDEVHGRVEDARKVMHKDYSMTWMYKKRKGEIFPEWKPSPEDDLEETYKIKDRTYTIYNMGFSEPQENTITVFVELIERYPDPDTGKLYQTPIVLVLEMEDDKIKTGRHYCDNNISFEDLNKKQLDFVYKNHKEKPLVIE